MKKILILLVTLYIAAYVAVYMYAQKECLGYKFETTEMTYDFQPYCVGISEGNMYVVPLQTLIKQGGFNMYPGPNG